MPADSADVVTLMQPAPAAEVVKEKEAAASVLP